MFRAKPIFGFACRFVIVFGLLIAPWPGWPEIYAKWLQKGATAAFGSFGSKGTVTFARNPSGDKAFDTSICVANREKPEESRSAMRGDFSSRMSAYYPTVLVIALVLATDVDWRRRLSALVWGLVWIHAFIAFLLGILIVLTINANPLLGLLEVSPFRQEILILLCKIFFTHLGAGFLVAVPVWIAVTFRRDDWINFLGNEKAGDAKRTR